MFDHHDVARHQVRGGKTHELVIRKVPRLDTKQYANRTAFDDSVSLRSVEFFRCQEGLCVFSVVVEDGRGQLDLARTLRDQLAHFDRDEFGELLGAFTHDRGGP